MAGLGMAQPMAAAQGAPQPDMSEDVDGGAPASPEEQQLYEKFVGAALDIIYPKGENAKVSPQIVDDLKGDVDPKVMSMFENADPPLASNPLDMVPAEAVMLTILIDENLGLSALKMQAREDDTGGEEPAGKEDDGAGEYGMTGREDDPNGEEPAGQEDDGAGEYGGKPDYDAVLMHAGKAIFEELIDVAEAAGLHDFTEQEIEGAWFRAMDLYRTAAETIGKTGYDPEALKAEFGQIVEANKAGNLNSILPGLPGGAPMQQGA